MRTFFSGYTTDHIKRGILLFLVLVSYQLSTAQPKSAFNPLYQFITSGNKLQDKDFYFLTLLKNDPFIYKELKEDAALAAITKESIDYLKKKSSSCNDSLDCAFSFLYWTPRKNDAVKKALINACHTRNEFKKLVNLHMRPSGYFAFYDSLTDEQMVAAAWQDAADALNYIIKAYTTGKEMRYPKIDSVSYPAADKYYRTLLGEMMQQVSMYRIGKMDLFFEPSLETALELLNINNRDEAARYEPLAAINAPACLSAKKIEWGKYEYAAILVLGEGPDLDNVPISPYGKLRCKAAAEDYRKGKAPLIIVSGGFVHPFQTPYCEAIEMKKYLVEECGIPANIIMADPHARHTTTNLRNANRIIFRSGIPAAKKILVVSSNAHVDYIFNGKFADRCETEIKHVPFDKMMRLSSFEFEYYPVKSSLSIFSMDPLDP